MEAAADAEQQKQNSDQQQRNASCQESKKVCRIFDYSHDAEKLKEQFVQFFIESVINFNVVDKMLEKRLNLEKQISEDGYVGNDVRSEIANLPVVFGSVAIPYQKPSKDVEGMVILTNYDQKEEFVEKGNMNFNGLPVYNIEMTASSFKDSLDENGMRDYLNQLIRNRLEEKIREKFQGSFIVFNLIVDPVLHSKLELCITQNRNVDEQLVGVVQSFFPGNANYYRDLALPSAKKECLNEIKEFLRHSYIKRDTKHVSHLTMVESFYTAPVCYDESEGRVQKRKRVKLAEDKKDD